MRKQSKIYIVGAIALLIIGLIAGTVFLYTQNNKSEKVSSTKQDVLGSNSKREISYDGKDGISALDLLKQNAKVVTSGEGESAFVTTINGVAAADNEFWQLSIDGEPAMVGAGSYITKSSEKINWVLTTF